MTRDASPSTGRDRHRGSGRELMKQAARYAPVRFLTKPIEPELLERTVQSLVGRKPASAGSADSQARARSSASDGGSRSEGWNHD